MKLWPGNTKWGSITVQLTLPSNIRLGWKGLSRTNTLVFHEHSRITSVKSFAAFRADRGLEARRRSETVYPRPVESASRFGSKTTGLLDLLSFKDNTTIFLMTLHIMTILITLNTREKLVLAPKWRCLWMEWIRVVWTQLLDPLVEQSAQISCMIRVTLLKMIYGEIEAFWIRPQGPYSQHNLLCNLKMGVIS